MTDGLNTVHGLRRELTKEVFEELVALQCEKEEILGYIGIPEKRLVSWCRRVYRRPLDEMITMIRQDGLIAIRRASFDQLKKSATIISQQYNRFLPNIGANLRDNGDAAIRAFTAAVAPSPENMAGLFACSEQEEQEEDQP